MKTHKTLIYFSFVIGLVFMCSGVFLVICSFKHEVLDNKYIIEESTEYISKKKDLSKGEFNVTKDVSYISKGKYKIIYKINYNQDDENILFENKSKVTITDVLGDGYKLDNNEILINNNPIKLYSYNTVTSDYTLNYENNTFEISFPKDKVFKYRQIIFYIELIDRDIDKKYITSKESYYSIVPNKKNDFYNKKTIQSYVIDGSGYIVLKNK